MIMSTQKSMKVIAGQSNTIHKTIPPQSKIIKIGQRAKPANDQVIKTDKPQAFRHQSPNNQQKRAVSLSSDKKQSVQFQRPQSPNNQRGTNFIKPRPNSPQPLPMPAKVQHPADQVCYLIQTYKKNEKLTKKFNTLVDKFNTRDEKPRHEQDYIQATKQERELQDQLSQIDKRIENHKHDVSYSSQHQHHQQSSYQSQTSQSSQNHQYQQPYQSPLEAELQKSINFLREENDRLRERLENSNQLDLNNIIKELSQKIKLKNLEIEQLRQSSEDITNDYMDLQNKITDDEQEKQDLFDLIQKLRFELDSQNQQIKKFMVEQDETLRKAEPLTPKFNLDQCDTKLRKEIVSVQNLLSDSQTRNKLLYQQIDQLKKVIDDLNAGSDEHLLYQVSEMESKLQECISELSSVTLNRNSLFDQLKKQQADQEKILKDNEESMHDVSYYRNQMDDLGQELVKTKQQLAEVINAAFEMGGADLVDLIGSKMNDSK